MLPLFLKTGVVRAILKSIGKVPWWSDKLKTCVREGAIRCAHSFKRNVSSSKISRDVLVFNSKVFLYTVLVDICKKLKFFKGVLKPCCSGLDWLTGITLEY